MFQHLDLSEDPIRREQLDELLGDNGFRHIRDKELTEEWQHETTKQIINVPKNEDFVPSDFVLHALRKANIDDHQMSLYEPIVYRNMSNDTDK